MHCSSISTSMASITRSPAMTRPAFSLFRSRSFGGANLVTLLFYTALTGSLYLLPFLMMHVHGYSAFVAGSAFLPFVAIAFLLGRLSGRICSRFGTRRSDDAITYSPPPWSASRL